MRKEEVESIWNDMIIIWRNLKSFTWQNTFKFLSHLTNRFKSSYILTQCIEQLCELSWAKIEAKEAENKCKVQTRLSMRRCQSLATSLPSSRSSRKKKKTKIIQTCSSTNIKNGSAFIDWQCSSNFIKSSLRIWRSRSLIPRQQHYTFFFCFLFFGVNDHQYKTCW